MQSRQVFVLLASLVLVSCMAKPDKNPKNTEIAIFDMANHYKLSELLTDSVNKVRKLNGAVSITHDTTLDNICKILLRKPEYKSTKSDFIEDSIRHLLYRNGIIDYQYDIIEVLDNDKAKVINSFLVADNFHNIRLGYNAFEGRNIFIKTKSYLKFDRWLISTHSDDISGFDNKAETEIITDSAICFLKSFIQGKYFYQFYHRIPLNSDKLSNVKLFEVNTGVATENEGKIMYDLKIKSTDPNAFLIISNSLNEKIAIVK